MGSGDPDYNDVAVNPPTGRLTNSGVQWLGNLGDTTGTPISPHHFLSANHIGFGSPATFVYQGVTYTTVDSFKVPGADLLVWEVSGTFPTYAPLFETGGGVELGRHLVVYGGGTDRGADYVYGTFRGWKWGAPGGGRKRWGENIVADLLNISGFGDQIYATFDAGAAGLGPYECHLSDRDSGGPVFIREAGVWKLAAVNFSVDGYFAENPTPPLGSDAFLAALVDCSGLYLDNFDGSPRQLIPGPAPVPTGFYSTRVAPYVAQIRAYIGNTDLRTNTFAGWGAACFTPAQQGNASISGPLADPDGDGLTNLEEFAFGGAPWIPSPEALPVAGTMTVSGTPYATISYNRATGRTGLTFVIEVSSDLQSWQSGVGQTVLVSETPQAELTRVVVRDLTPGTGKRALRVRVTMP